ncbi:MAG: TRIC cation channel family protein [Burkholderiaceae bacterium]
MEKVQFWGETLRLLVRLSATAAFALAGIAEAARKRLDAVGVCVVGFLAAFGGGTLRDLLLDQRRPFFWVNHVNVLWGVLVLCVLAMGFLRSHHFHLTEKAIQWPDALGWACLPPRVCISPCCWNCPHRRRADGVDPRRLWWGVEDVVCNQISTPPSATALTRCVHSQAGGSTWAAGLWRPGMGGLDRQRHHHRRFYWTGVVAQLAVACLEDLSAARGGHSYDHPAPWFLEQSSVPAPQTRSRITAIPCPTPRMVPGA